MPDLIPASDCTKWRQLLSAIAPVDCSYLPEYHLAYSLRIPHSKPLLWHFEHGNDQLLYPFLLTPVMVDDEVTGYSDISSVYGYTGPIATTTSSEFLKNAWKAFDDFAQQQNIIAEFIRFSPINQTERFAHPKTQVEANRTLAISHLSGSEEELLQKIGSKTRNMLRKAHDAGLTACELALPEYLPAFRALYEDTMHRNNASEFFWYDDAYYEKLLMLKNGELRLLGVFANEVLVGAAMAIAHGKSALYHLGASLPDYARLGAGNLSLFTMSVALMKNGVEFINMTGGRTTSPNDSLLSFKKSNATGTATFYIGKRIVNPAAYTSIQEKWEETT